MMRFQIFSRKIGIELGLYLSLALVENVIEFRHIDVQRNFAEHLNEPAVAIVSKSRISGLLRQTLQLLGHSSPRFRIVFIIPGIENFAPDRTLTSSGSSAPPSFLPISFSSVARALWI